LRAGSSLLASDELLGEIPSAPGATSR
jgi:hypothetical protein